MNIAFTMQKFQDWLTQQCVILWGRKFNPSKEKWLMGPFGEVNGIGEKFIYQLAEKEGLFINRNVRDRGLLKSISQLNLSENELKKLSPKVIDFYEKTSNYELLLDVKWHPSFKVFGFILNRLFSKRINQLNIPLQNNKHEKISSEIIELIDPRDMKVKYTIWLRKFEQTGKVIYSGIYETCVLPSKKTCIKAIFPLPKGNATVIMLPSIGNHNELILNSCGTAIGESGFYFLLNDSKNNYWTHFIKSFTDKLVIREINKNIVAKQTLKLWNLKVIEFNYTINYINNISPPSR